MRGKYFFNFCEEIYNYLKYYHLPINTITISPKQIIKSMNKTKESVLFVDIKENPEPIVIESLCVQCENNGKTTLLMTKIPFFR